MRKYTVLLLLLALLLSGCGAEPESASTLPAAPTQSAQPTQPPVTEDPGKFDVTLELWVTRGDIWADEAQVTEMLENFRAYYPNIAVNVLCVSPENLGSDLPDLLLGDTDTLSALAAQGKLSDLTDLWQGIDDAYGHVEEACGIGGSYFALPLCQVVDCMAIRLPDFQRADCMSLINTAQHTWTTSAFLQVAENLSLSGVENPVSIYCQDTSADVNTRLLVENLSGIRYLRTQDGACQIDSPPMTQGIQSISQAPGLVLRRDLNDDEALEEFLAGDSAMVLNWNSALQLRHGDQGDIFCMLYPSNGSSRTCAEVYGLAVCETEDVRQRTASLTLAAFLRDSLEAVRATTQLPARESGFEAYRGTDLESRMEDLAMLLSHVEKGGSSGNIPENARKEWVKLLQRIADGEDVILAIEACRDALTK